MNKPSNFSFSEQPVKKRVILRTIWNVMIMIALIVLCCKLPFPHFVKLVLGTRNPAFIIFLLILGGMAFYFSLWRTILCWQEYLKKNYIEITGTVQHDCLSHELFIQTHDGQKMLLFKPRCSKNDSELFKVGEKMVFTITSKTHFLLDYQLINSSKA